MTTPQDSPVWMCAMCFSDMDHSTTCFQCGSSGTAISTTKSLMRLVQKHDQQRLEDLAKKEQELRALRHVMMKIMHTPLALGMRVETYNGNMVGVRYKNRVVCGSPLPNETEHQFMMRVGEAVALDPVDVRNLMSLKNEASPSVSNGDPPRFRFRPGDFNPGEE